MTRTFNKDNMNINMNNKKLTWKITYNPQHNINDNNIRINITLTNITNRGNNINMNIKKHKYYNNNNLNKRTKII